TGLARRTRCALRREDPRRGPGGPPLPAGTVVERGRATGERGGRLRGGGDRTQRRRPPVAPRALGPGPDAGPAVVADARRREHRLDGAGRPVPLPRRAP